MSGADERDRRESVDVTVIGGGPAGLSAALNLARARRTVTLVDAGRPRNAATLLAHGFITRDGIPPHELRALAATELERYPEAKILRRTSVVAAEPAESIRDAAHPQEGARVQDGAGADATARAAADAARFALTLSTGRTVRARALVVATGLRETLPALPSIRAYYGMSLFSCVACDGYERRDGRLALIGECATPADGADLLARALLVAQWSPHLTVFSNGSDAVSAADEAELAARGIRVERREIEDLEGERGAVTGVRLKGGEVVPIDGGFVRPGWHPALDAVAGLALELDAEGLLVADRDGRTSVAGVYAAGDVSAPGPAQLIVAAGEGARVASVVNQDLIGVLTSH